MFARIAHRYDFTNRLMTFGQDVRWRREVIRRARLAPNASLLDLGTGTGDLAREALKRQPSAKVTAADFTMEMMKAGIKNGNWSWTAADALNLPFRDKTFDAIVSGFLMRNVTDVQRSLNEQFRALKKGGRIVILDTTRPKPNSLSPLIRFHTRVVIPLLGGMLTGFREAYRYLPDSTEKFLTAEELAARMIVAGFRKVDFRRLSLGMIAIHWGEKGKDEG